MFDEKMIIHVKVIPNSERDEIIKVSDNNYITKVKEPAQDNKANIKLIKLLSKHFEINYKQIKIKNPTSRKKIVEIKEQ